MEDLLKSPHNVKPTDKKKKKNKGVQSHPSQDVGLSLKNESLPLLDPVWCGHVTLELRIVKIIFCHKVP